MPTQLSYARGVARLAFDAAGGVADVVERMHGTIGRFPLPFGAVRSDATSGITRFVYGAVRGGLRWAAIGADAGLAAFDRPGDAVDPHPRVDALLAAVNGVYGDHLERTGNPLAIETSLWLAGRRLDTDDVAGAFAAAPAPTPRLLLLVHGLCMSDRHWLRRGHDHGAALAADAGYTPVYVRYNSGLGIAENGRRLSSLLERLVRRWPVPMTELAIVGHSMGGLVARSAYRAARRARHGWPGAVSRLVFLGTPQHGAPLEQGGRWLDALLAASPYSAPIGRLGRARSAGIRDLREGRVADDGVAVAPLPRVVACYAVAATLASRGGLLADRLVGDGLVPLHSALGRHADPRRSLEVPGDRQCIAWRTSHLDLLASPVVYERLLGWLRDPASPAHTQRRTRRR